MKKNKMAFAVVFVLIGAALQAQSPNANTIVDGGPWSVGLGMNSVENNGYRGHEVLKLNTWSTLTYPSRLSIKRETGNGFSMELAYTHNQISKGTIVDRGPNPTTRYYNAIDLSIKYNLHIFFDNSKFWLKPFILGGTGYSNMYPYPSNENDGSFIFKTLSGYASANIGAGFDVCFNNIFPKCDFLSHFALSFQTMGKFTDDSNDLIQHSFTIVYGLPRSEHSTPKLL